MNSNAVCNVQIGLETQNGCIKEVLQNTYSSDLTGSTNQNLS